MPPSTYAPPWQRSLIVLTGTVVTATLIAAAYWVQDVLIPIALATYLSFILTPLVRICERARLGRVASVMVVVLLISLLLTAVGLLVSRQINSLSAELPNYRANILEHVREIRAWRDTGRFGDLMGDVAQAISEPEQVSSTSERTANEPVLVKEQSDSPFWMAYLTNWGGLTLSFGTMIMLSMILLVFILLKREDLRSRFLWLFGRHTLTSTTKAVEDAAHRLSRFLMTQALVNGSYGVIFGIGLYFIGVKYALLWGLLGALFQYLPFVGPWISAIFPIALSLAMSDSWAQPAMVVGFVLVLELINNNVIEPYLYGRSIGLSEVALLVGAAFWTWLWGPIGLVLSPPLMVVLVVLGKHVPSLEFLSILLGDEPIFDPQVMYFQRLLARDHDEAMRYVLERSQQPEPERIYDELLVPALGSAQLAQEQKTISQQDLDYILNAIDETLDDLGESPAFPVSEEETSEQSATRVRLLCCPTRDGADQVAQRILYQALPSRNWDVDLIGHGKLAGELLEDIGPHQPAAVCLVTVSQGGLARTRYYCKRLRQRFPQTKIIVGRWGGHLTSTSENRIHSAGADYVCNTVLETCKELQSLFPVLEHLQRSLAGLETTVEQDDGDGSETSEPSPPESSAHAATTAS